MKILIITGKFGMGHISAAEALAAQLRNDFFQAEVIVEDIYHIVFPHGCQGIYRTYSALMASPCSKLVNNAYKKAVNSEAGVPAELNFIEKQALRRLEAYIGQTQPDMIVTTYSLASRLVSDYKRLNRDDVPAVTCITDITIHNVWTNPGTDLYLAASEETRQSLIEAGVSPGRIAISGVPVSERYQPAPFKLRQGQQRELLIMGGGLGLMSMEHSFYKKLSRIEGLHTTVICGKNRSLYRKLKAQKYSHMDIIGFTGRVDQYMRQADLLLSKPGGATMFEAIKSELPMLVLPPFLEQEIKNAEYIADHGLGLVLDQEADMAAQVETIIKAGPLLALMRGNERRLRHSLNSHALSDYIEELLCSGERRSA